MLDGRLPRIETNALQLAEPLLKAVDVVAGEIIGLFDDPVTGEPATESSELSVDALDLGLREDGDLFETVEPDGMQRVGKFRSDTL